MNNHTLSLIRIRTLALTILFLLFTGLCYAQSNETRAISVRLKNNTGKVENVSLYKGSFALLIGVSKYHAGWPMLESIPGEINEVESLLQKRGFKVVKLLDPNSTQLENGFKSFIDRYGFEKENRLLFFFSGHGHTRLNGRKGYLVPIDAPDPDQDLTGFLQKSLGMNQVLSWARDIEAKHALFLFDSCFSGTVFKQKARISPPPHITRLTIEPVRQFITAGSAGETVPANSTFTPAFIDALRYGLADLNKDGYVSATELGLHLRTVVPAHTKQNPQFGTIRDYELSRGDFIFMTDVTAAPDEQARSTGILKIQSTPVGASVYVDNNFQGTTPVTLTGVSTGMHTIRVHKHGYSIETKNIQVSAGRSVTIAFPLINEAADGSLTIATTPTGTTITFSGGTYRYTPGMKLPVGTYNLVVSKHGFVSENLRIQVNANEDLHLNVTLKQHTAVATPDNRPTQATSTPSTLEDPNLQRVIKPEQDTANQGTTLRKVEPQTTPETAGEDPNLRRVQQQPATLSSTNKKIIHQSAIPKEIQSYISRLKSSDSKLKRTTARIIYKKKIEHPMLYLAIEEELLSGSTQNLKNRHHVDAMAWLCNILGRTKDKKYRHTLKKVSKSKTHKKIRSYALKNLKYLK